MNIKKYLIRSLAGDSVCRWSERKRGVVLELEYRYKKWKLVKSIPVPVPLYIKGKLDRHQAKNKKKKNKTCNLIRMIALKN
jgi:hypothetical protein